LAVSVAAGAINTVVGSGSLITFPTLLALGYPPVMANVSNNLGLVPGSAAGAYGYRAELKGQAGALRRLVPVSMLGGLLGAVLLITLPERAFTEVVIALIVLALVLVVVQPRLARRLAGSPRGGRVGFVLQLGVFGTGVYGGYFGAAQGVILLALLGSFLDGSLQRVNGVKNVLTLTVNGVAAIVFVLIAPHQVNWPLVAVIAVGATIGGAIGARVGRRLPQAALRAVIAVVGVLAIVKLVSQL
jgi:uncharacterized membrane protein YfcA